MTNIPPEYSNIDFGFSAIDEATFKSNQESLESISPPIDENDITRAVLNALSPIEDKLNILLQRKKIEESDVVENAIEEAQNEVRTKVIELEKIIMPLLVNLLKTADKEYIHWPNRATQVQNTINKILAITRS